MGSVTRRISLFLLAFLLLFRNRKGKSVRMWSFRAPPPRKEWLWWGNKIRSTRCDQMVRLWPFIGPPILSSHWCSSSSFLARATNRYGEVILKVSTTEPRISGLNSCRCFKFSSSFFIHCCCCKYLSFDGISFKQQQQQQPTAIE